MKKHRKSGFFLKLFMVLAILVAICSGAYFAIDKLVVPKYFSNYGIHNLSELVGMMTTLYNSPKESEFITNGYTKADETSANKKLIQKANFPETSVGSGKVDYVSASNGEVSMTPGVYHFTDRELGSILNDIANSGVLPSKMPYLKHINDINITVMEFIVSPAVVVDENKFSYSSEKADVSCTFKIDTSLVREAMAESMDTPLFLLNMIIPKNLYITVNYTFALNEEREWVIEEENMGINGRSAKESQILIDLMIDFIFPEEEQMTSDKLTKMCGDVILTGIGLIGDLSFEYNIDSTGTNGVIITINENTQASE